MHVLPFSPYPISQSYVCIVGSYTYNQVEFIHSTIAMHLKKSEWKPLFGLYSLVWEGKLHRDAWNWLVRSRNQKDKIPSIAHVYSKTSIVDGTWDTIREWGFASANPVILGPTHFHQEHGQLPNYSFSFWPSFWPSGSQEVLGTRIDPGQFHQGLQCWWLSSLYGVSPWLSPFP